MFLFLFVHIYFHTITIERGIANQNYSPRKSFSFFGTLFPCESRTEGETFFFFFFFNRVREGINPCKGYLCTIDENSIHFLPCSHNRKWVKIYPKWGQFLTAESCCVSMDAAAGLGCEHAWVMHWTEGGGRNYSGGTRKEEVHGCSV